MKNVYYPLAGMNYIINDLAEIIKNKMDGKQEIVLCFRHRLIVTHMSVL